MQLVLNPSIRECGGQTKSVPSPPSSSSVVVVNRRRRCLSSFLTAAAGQATGGSDAADASTGAGGSTAAAAGQADVVVVEVDVVVVVVASSSSTSEARGRLLRPSSPRPDATSEKRLGWAPERGRGIGSQRVFRAVGNAGSVNSKRRVKKGAFWGPERAPLEAPGAPLGRALGPL